MPTPGGSVRPEQLRVRQNDPSSISGLPTTSDPRPPTRVPTWVWSGALVVLMVLTSLAVASVSVWLVLPYFALMALILFTPAGRGEREVGCASGVGGRVRRRRRIRRSSGLWPGSKMSLSTVNGASRRPRPSLWSSLPRRLLPTPSLRAVKTKRGKGRMRKAKAVAESPGATATWIQIGPGKFVRVENPGSPVAAAFPSSEGEVSG